MYKVIWPRDVSPPFKSAPSLERGDPGLDVFPSAITTANIPPFRPLPFLLFFPFPFILLPFPLSPFPVFPSFSLSLPFHFLSPLTLSCPSVSCPVSPFLSTPQNPARRPGGVLLDLPAGSGAKHRIAVYCNCTNAQLERHRIELELHVLCRTSR